MLTPKIHIVVGATAGVNLQHIDFSGVQSAPIGYRLAQLTRKMIPKMETYLHLTQSAVPGVSPAAVKLAAKAQLNTNADVMILLDKLIADNRTKIIILPCAQGVFSYLPGGEGNGSYIRRKRKDITLIGLDLCILPKQKQYIEGLNTLKANSANLIYAYNPGQYNMVIVPEESAYFMGRDQEKALKGLVYTARERSQLTFTHSTVVAGEPVKWASPEIPSALRSVVNHCIKRKAYKPFRGVTAGHFAVKLNDTTFLTSRRKTNFNQLPKLGLVKVTTDGPDTVLAYGSKPSVGGQSQRIVFKDHPGLDCIVHFHCPKRKGSRVPTVSQLEVECGSHQCGKNTSRGLKSFGDIKVVYLDNHGPNIVFSSKVDPKKVISFIESNFDLEAKTGGLVS